MLEVDRTREIYFPITSLPVVGITRKGSPLEMRPRRVCCSMLFETAGDTGCAVKRFYRWCLSRSSHHGHSQQGDTEHPKRGRSLGANLGHHKNEEAWQGGL
jgi:hypothetical protein